MNALMDADRQIPSDSLDSYHDTRKFSKAKNATLHYHKYKFVVRVETNDGRGAIYYVNPHMAGTASGQKIVTIPKHSKTDSYYLFTSNELHQIIKQYSTEMSPKVTKLLDKIKKTGQFTMFHESAIEYSEELQILNESSPIMRSLMELKFRTNPWP